MADTNQMNLIEKRKVGEAKKKLAIYLKSVDWNSKLAKDATSSIGVMGSVMAKYDGETQTVRIIDELKKLGDNAESVPDVLSEHAGVVLNTIITGFAVGWTVGEQYYGESSGLNSLRDRASGSSLSALQSQERDQKLETEAAVCMFVAASYIVKSLSKYRTDEVAGRTIPKVTVPEFVLLRKQKAIECTLFGYGSYLPIREVVADDLALVKFTIEYFTSVLGRVEQRLDSLQYKGFHEERSYELENSDFTITGFKRSETHEAEVVVINPTKLEDIVGNRQIKLLAERMVSWLLTYCMKEKRNPLQMLGGMARIVLWMGIPGTGKTLLIRAVTTMLMERCKDLKIPFLYHELPPDLVSKFQGETAERMNKWFQKQLEFNGILFCPIDDAETNFPDPTSHLASEGTAKITGVFLTGTEGTKAVWNGNSAIPFATNNVQLLAPAVLSRIKMRAVIEGAMTEHDFLDQEYLWWKVLDEQEPGFINMLPMEGYKYLDDQKLLKSISDLEKGGEYDIKNEKVKQIFMATRAKYDPKKHHAFFASFNYEMKKRFSFYSSRDVSSVNTAVLARLMDFSYPQEWWDDPGMFFAKTYQEKFKMLLEKRRENMKGLSFGDIRLSELLKYADTAVIINETAEEKEIQAMVQQILRREEAERRALKIINARKAA